MWKALQEAQFFYEVVQMRQYDVDPGAMLHCTEYYLDGGYYVPPKKGTRFLRHWNPYMSICADKHVLDICIVRSH